MKNISVFEGNELKSEIPDMPTNNTRCFLYGKDSAGKPARVPVNEDLLSKHFLFLGSIGTGKTNGILQLVMQLRETMSQKDVMLIFDTKGDFYNTFYQPGDIVISNDDKATGPAGADYWNIFNEIEQNESMEENIIEIARSLFYDRTQISSQPFFPNAARD